MDRIKEQREQKNMDTIVNLTRVTITVLYTIFAVVLILMPEVHTDESNIISYILAGIVAVSSIIVIATMFTNYRKLNKSLIIFMTIIICIILGYREYCGYRTYGFPKVFNIDTRIELAASEHTIMTWSIIVLSTLTAAVIVYKT